MAGTNYYSDAEVCSEPWESPKPRRRTARGFVVYRGPSALDGAPVVAIVTTKSENAKTGPMAQLWILSDSGVPPARAKVLGLDSAVCGDCPVRSACYVRTEQGPGQIWRTYQSGGYEDVSPEDVRSLPFVSIRLGAYGDPAALPSWVLHALTDRAREWTGYTHQWRRPGLDHASLKRHTMASVESPAGRREAKRRGWRTFRIRPRGAPLEPGEIDCPSATGLQCIDCRLCDGTRRTAADISIPVHGAKAGMAERAGTVR